MNFNLFDEGCLFYTIIYLFAFFSTLLVTGKKPRNFCFLLIVLVEILLASLRGVSVGRDTVGYVEYIIPQLKYFSYGEIISGSEWLVEKEPVCYCFLKFICAPFVSFTPYFFILQTIYWVLIADTMLRYSKDPLLSLFVFIAFRFSFFNMSALRQSLALALAMFSYRFFVNNNKKMLVLFIGLAFLFHRSALVLILLLFVDKVNLIKKQWFVYVAAIVVLGLSYLTGSVTEFVGVNDSEIAYAGYLVDNQGGGNYFSVVFMLMVFILISMCVSKIGKDAKNTNSRFYNVVVVAFIISMYGLFVSVFFRVSMYYAFFVPIIYANFLKSIENIRGYRLLYALGIVAMAVVYVFTGVVEDYIPYKFYWE